MAATAGDAWEHFHSCAAISRLIFMQITANRSGYLVALLQGLWHMIPPRSGRIQLLKFLGGDRIAEGQAIEAAINFVYLM